jgi:uncharacterized membrane protein YbhN (UPF0104 family)
VSKAIAVCTIIVWVGAWITVSLIRPWVFDDTNTFLKNFVNHEFLGFMGVIVTITLASAANLFIELNKLEEKVNMAVFRSAKRHVKDSAFSLIGLLIASLVLVVVKPLVEDDGPTAQAISNGLALTIILVSVLILIDLTQAAFSLDPNED